MFWRKVECFECKKKVSKTKALQFGYYFCSTECLANFCVRCSTKGFKTY